MLSNSFPLFYSATGYPLPWEDPSFEYPGNFASPVEVAIEASNGASDYGNKFGEPVLAGFARSFGMKLSNGERREYVKPIMFSGGIGMLNSKHVCKEEPQKGERGHFSTDFPHRIFTLTSVLWCFQEFVSDRILDCQN